jgi:hypothetical protein
MDRWHSVARLKSRIILAIALLNKNGTGLQRQIDGLGKLSIHEEPDLSRVLGDVRQPLVDDRAQWVKGGEVAADGILLYRVTILNSFSGRP